MIDNNLRTAQSKTAFNLISKLSIIHPQRRDGGIMQCYMDEQEEMVAGSEEVLHSCLQVLCKTSGRDTSDKSQTAFPNLPPLSEQQVRYIQYAASYNKALTLDGWSDAWIKKTERWDLLANLWNQESMALLRKSFEAKLVPLNKVWPDIPKADQFRPIVIESPLYKFVELRFYYKLRQYLKRGLDRNQTGFVPGMGTSVNIQVLIE